MGNRSNINLVGNTTQGQNIGIGEGVYTGKSVGNILKFKKLSVAGTTMVITSDDENIYFSAATGGGDGTITGGSNGLSTSGADIVLGGALTGDTIIGGSDTHTLSITGATFKITDSAVLNVSTGSGIDKILRSDAVGDTTWIDIPVKDAVNALTLTDGTVLLGGELIQETEIELNSNLLSINNQNPPFDIGTGFDAGVYTVSEDSDGKYVAAGAFHNYSGVTAEGLVRLNTDGSRDTTLEIGSGFWKTGGSTAVSTHTIQSDGKILVGGSFTQYSGVSYSNLVRLNSDGNIDTGFTPPESSLAGVRVIYVKDNGKILVGGDFTNHLIQLKADGTTDTNFVVGTGFAGGETVAWTFVLDIKEQSDGQLLIAGDYNSYSGITAGHLIRLNPDGSYDNTFDTNPGFDRRVRTISIQSDGSMVVGGEFVEYEDSTLHNASGIAKLNSDATFDDTFDIGDGFTGNTGTELYHIGVKHILQQVNGQFLVTGFFTWYNGTVANGVIRLNSDATIDSSFDSGTGFDSVPNDAIITSNGKFLLGGGFTEYSGVTSNSLIRLSYYGDIDNQALDSMVKFNGKVVEYGDNYESYYTNRSLVDKEYVDSASGGDGTITGGSNGLSTSGANIVLGGDLTGNTCINTNGYGMVIATTESVATGADSVALGGYYSQACAACSAILGGDINVVQGLATRGAIIGGDSNEVDSPSAAIIGSTNSHTGTGNTNTVIIGGSTIIPDDDDYSEHAIVPSLAIWDTPSAGSGSDAVLVWNVTDKKVKCVAQSTSTSFWSGGTGFIAPQTITDDILLGDNSCISWQNTSARVSAIESGGNTWMCMLNCNSCVAIGPTGAIDINSSVSITLNSGNNDVRLCNPGSCSGGEDTIFINSTGQFVSGTTGGGGLDAYSALSYAATVVWDTSVGLNKTLSTSASFTLSLTNLSNGMSGDLRLNVTSGPVTITLPTSKLNGIVTSIPIGIYHLTWVYDGTNTDFNIALYE